MERDNDRIIFRRMGSDITGNPIKGGDDDMIVAKVGIKNKKGNTMKWPHGWPTGK